MKRHLALGLRCLFLVGLGLSSKLAAAAAKPVVPAPAAFRPPSAASLRAAGLSLIVQPQSELPLVTLTVAVQAGSELDPPDRPGLSAAVALMLDEGGAGERDGKQLAEALDDLGGSLSLSSDEEGIQASLTVMSTRLEPAMALLADLFLRPRFDDAAWARAKRQRISEIRQRQSEPDSAAAMAFWQAVFGDHPHGHSSLGTEASLEAMTADELRRFHADHFGPASTALVVSGDVTAERAAHLVEAHFAGWRSKAQRPAPPPLPTPAVPRRIPLERAGAPQTQVLVGHLGIGRGSADYPAALLLKTILGGSFTSRLMQNLREKHGYTYGASASFVASRNTGLFVVACAVRSDATAAALSEIQGELDRLRAEPVGQEELDKARALLRQSLVAQYASTASAAELLAQLYLQEQPLDAWSRLLTAVDRLDVAELSAAAKRLLTSERFVVLLGDKDALATPPERKR